MAILSLNLFEREPVATKEIQVKPVLQKKPIQEVAMAKPKPTPPPQVMETMVKPFSIRTIDHDVIVEQVGYHIHVRDLDWLHGGYATWAKVIISRPSKWEVGGKENLMLTHGGRPNDCTDQMIGVFAQAGMAVNRRLIDACLFPIQNQILEVERQLKSFA